LRPADASPNPNPAKIVDSAATRSATPADSASHAASAPVVRLYELVDIEHTRGHLG
jgi:hypothetical protein